MLHLYIDRKAYLFYKIDIYLWALTTKHVKNTLSFKLQLLQCVNKAAKNIYFPIFTIYSTIILLLFLSTLTTAEPTVKLKRMFV